MDWLTLEIELAEASIVERKLMAERMRTFFWADLDAAKLTKEELHEFETRIQDATPEELFAIRAELQNYIEIEDPRKQWKIHNNKQ